MLVDVLKQPRRPRAQRMRGHVLQPHASYVPRCTSIHFLSDPSVFFPYQPRHVGGVDAAQMQDHGAAASLSLFQRSLFGPGHSAWLVFALAAAVHLLWFIPSQKGSVGHHKCPQVSLSGLRAILKLRRTAPSCWSLGRSGLGVEMQ